jgi:hypothetical protein
LRKTPWKDLRFHNKALGLHKTPQRHLKPYNAALGAWGRRAGGEIPATSPASSAGEVAREGPGVERARWGDLLRRTHCRQAGTAETRGGGRWELCFGEPAAWAGQQASVGAIGGPSGGRSSTCWRCQQPEGRARRVSSPAGRQLCCGSAPVREGTRRPGLYSQARRRRRFASVQSLQGRDMGEDGQRRARGRRANGARRWSSPASGSSFRGADHGPARVTHRENPTPCMDRRTLAVLRVRVRRTRQ